MQYAVFAATDTADVARVLGEAFSRRDPPAVATGLTAAEFDDFVRLLCPRAGAEGLTIVARATATGEVAGVLLAEDSASATPDGLDRISDKFLPIFDILSLLDASYRAGRPPRPGESLHLFLLGVAASFEGQGIAQQLVTRCLDNGRRRGYRIAVTEATSRRSQHVFRKLGFVERARQSYADHRFEGRAVFAPIAGQGGPILMDAALT